MDVFAEHGVAGIVGLLFNALFADDSVVGLDGVNTGLHIGGWVIHNWKQLYVQVAYIVATCAYSFVVSALIAYAINAIPGLNLRASEEAELLGMDDDQLGEFAYDYVEVRRDYLAWTPQKHDQLEDGHEIPAADRYGIGPHSDMMLEGHPPTGETSRTSRGGSSSGSSSGGGQPSHDFGSSHESKIPPAPRPLAEQTPAREAGGEPPASPLKPINEKAEN